MKAFIFVALVASVAARSMDLDTLRLIKEKSLLNTRPIVDDVLLKEKLINELPLERNTLLTKDVDTVLPLEKLDTLRTDVDLTHGIRGIYDNVDRVLTIDELYTTELFREYLRLPLFREYVQYPIFQRYVSSIYFQRFWTVSTFKQYFVNPVLFYKYVYPMVQLFKNEYNLPINTVYGQDSTVLGHQNLFGLDVEDLIYKNKMNTFPFAYNTRFGLPTTTSNYYNTFGTTNYKFLLDKVYKTLFQNQPLVGDVTEVKTDVKILPQEKTVVVEPITGERKVVIEPKIVDVKVAQKVVPVEKVLVDDVLVNEREVLLAKLLLKENVITPVIYEQVIRGQIDLVTVLREIYGTHVDITDVIRQLVNVRRDVLLNDKEILLVKILLKEHVITPEIFESVIRGEIPLITVLRQIYGNHVDITDVIRQIITRRDVLDIPVQNRIVDDVLINNRDVLLLNEKEILLAKLLLKENVITPVIYEQVIRGQINLVTVLREIYGRNVDVTDVIRQLCNVRRDVFLNLNEKEILLVKLLLKEHIITPEIFEAVIRGQIELTTVLREIFGRHVTITDVIRMLVNHRENVVDTIYNRIPTVDRYTTRFDRYNNVFNRFNKYNKYNTIYNTEIPTLRENIFERLPLQKMLGNIVA